MYLFPDLNFPRKKKSLGVPLFQDWNFSGIFLFPCQELSWNSGHFQAIKTASAPGIQSSDYQTSYGMD
jgi:hypothetical protein